MSDPEVPSLEDEIRQDEGVRHKPYMDSLGRWAIGVGFDLAAHGYTHQQIMALTSTGWSDETTNVMLASSIHTVLAFITAHLPWAASLRSVRNRVLVNMAFNVGCGGLLRFDTFLGLVQRGQYEQAAEDLLTTLAAKELPQRYGRLAARMATGDYFSTWKPPA